MCNISERYFEDGKKEGRQEGRQEEKIELAKYFLVTGEISKESIAKATGLDPKYVNELAKQLNPHLGA